MDLSVLKDGEGFREHVLETLGKIPSDYVKQPEFMGSNQDPAAPWNAAGVLLPLYFSEGEEGKDKDSREYVFLLNKRSQKVQQAGDLCAPGGGIHLLSDWIFQKLLGWGLFPFGRGPGLEEAKRQGRDVFEKVLFFFGNALRESWEEIHLSPFNVEFLGVLPTYRLQSRRWTLFPVVGRIKKTWKAKLSWEVEKIVPIPLRSFYQPENYALYSLRIPDKLKGKGIPDPWEFPCLVYPSEKKEEILWGATFHIIRSFLGKVFNFPLPIPNDPKVIRRTLPSNYFSGRREP